MNPQVSTPEAYAHKLAVLSRYCEEIDRDPAALVKTQGCSCIALASREADARGLAEASAFDRHTRPEMPIIGTPEMVADRLRPYQELGVEHFIIARFADAPRLDGALQFAAEVVPLLRSP
jgi:alkanesulfonate monooxygenase SsuD/methylene tetrahydromethanopterin reductase-like flavin-dependent oxidoreductase (luciferase family)